MLPIGQRSVALHFFRWVLAAQAGLHVTARDVSGEVTDAVGLDGIRSTSACGDIRSCRHAMVRPIRCFARLSVRARSEQIGAAVDCR